MAPSSDSDNSRRRNKKGEGSQLRQELIAAAMRLLDRAPGTQLSLRMVAREAGVAAPSVYPHFSDARTMMNAIVRECWNQMAEEMNSANAATDQFDLHSALHAQLEAYVRYATERPSRYQLLFAIQLTDSAEDLDLPGLTQPVFRKVRSALKAIREAGGSIPGKDSFSASLTIMSTVHGRIALAHLAPHREGNSSIGVQAFVTEILSQFVPRPS